MKVALRFASLLLGLFLWNAQVMWAQPANDFCEDAIELTFYDSAEEAVPVEGDTRGTTDGNLDNIPACSVNNKRDDVWYKFTSPDAPSGWTIEFVFGDQGTDIPAVGYAVYASCDRSEANQPLDCVLDSESRKLKSSTVCQLVAGNEYYLRVWSAIGLDPDWQEGAGTFRLLAYLSESEAEPEDILWGANTGEGDFNGGLNDWTVTSVNCSGQASDGAVWQWNIPGSALTGAFATGQSNLSPSRCNGAMVFNSDFLDNAGNSSALGSGPCPAPQEAHLTSPIIDISAFDVPGVVVQFHQNLRQYQSEYYVGYSTDGGATWTDVQINEEHPLNSSHINEFKRVSLPGVVGASELRLRFRIVGNYYYWVIDDVQLVQQECTNTRIMANWYTLPPWASMPSNQTFAFPVMADIFNAGACPQDNVRLNYRVVNVNTEEVVYDETLNFGTVESDNLVENELFPSLVVMPAVAAGSIETYSATFTLSQDNEDFDPADNVISTTFQVGGDVFALEDGPNSNRISTVSRSYVIGNYFHPSEDATVQGIQWGIVNPAQMAGISVNIYLMQWTDLNGNETIEASERLYVGFGEYTFTGLEDANNLIFTELENFNVPGEPVVMDGGLGYLALVEYQAESEAAPQMVFHVQERNYFPTNYAFDVATDEGLTNRPFYAGIFGTSATDPLSIIDYNPVRSSTPGNNWAAVIRIVTQTTINTKDVLPSDNLISVYPNPASTQIHVKMDFAKAFDGVKIKVMDNAGKLVDFKSLNNVGQNRTETININHLAPGQYHMQVITKDGYRTVPFVVIQ